MNRSLLIDLNFVLLLILLGAVGYKLTPLIHPRADVVLPVDVVCWKKPTSANLSDLSNLSAATGAAASSSAHRCSMAVPQLGEAARISLELPDPVPLAKAFPITVHLANITAKRVRVDFAGVSMNMGLNRNELTAQGDADLGRYQGQITLPVCITGAMDWQATVLVDTEHERVAAPWQLTTRSGL